MNRLFCILSFYAFSLLISCKHKEEHHEEASKFLVTSPIRIDTTINTEYVSQIRAIQHIEVRALEKGYLQNIYVDEGQYIKKGQLKIGRAHV